jgi:hypothetical protein
MLPLEDTRWATFKGGYHVDYDASPILRTLLEEGATEELWAELWQELHHQGDVDSASYAAVPWLLEYARRCPRLDWNVFGLICIIELERPHNPLPPEELVQDYFQALARLPEVVALHPDRQWDTILTQCIVACLALTRGQRLLARVYSEMDHNAARQWLEENVGYALKWEAEE